MNASLLTTFQTEPWSLVLLGATLFALSAVAKRRSAAVPAPVSPAVIVDRVAVPPASVRVERQSDFVAA